MVTVNGIYNNIDESTYYSDIVDNNKTYRFYFSSQSYVKKFEERINEYIITESQKLNLKYNSKIEASIMLIFNFYSKLETRGFRVQVDEKVLKESPLFNLEIAI